MKDEGDYATVVHRIKWLAHVDSCPGRMPATVAYIQSTGA
jgi:hypothetical protein